MHEGGEPRQERGAEGRLDRQERGAALKIGVGLLLVILFVIFIIQNSDPVLVNFVLFESRIRLVWVFLVCALLGALVTWLVGRPRRRAMKRLVEELERRGKD